MGTLLDFSSAPRPTSRVQPRRNRLKDTDSESQGEVVFFPGVRYERMALDLSARIGTIGKVAGPALSDKD